MSRGEKLTETFGNFECCCLGKKHYRGTEFEMEKNPLYDIISQIE